MEANSEQIATGKIHQVLSLMQQLGIDRELFSRIETELFPDSSDSDSDTEIVELSTNDMSMLQFPTFEEVHSRIDMEREDYDRTHSVWMALGQFDYSSYTPIFTDFTASFFRMIYSTDSGDKVLYIGTVSNSSREKHGKGIRIYK